MSMTDDELNRLADMVADRLKQQASPSYPVWVDPAHWYRYPYYQPVFPRVWSGTSTSSGPPMSAYKRS